MQNSGTLQVAKSAMDKPQSEFLLLVIQCSYCKQRIPVSDIANDLCPKCNRKLKLPNIRIENAQSVNKVATNKTIKQQEKDERIEVIKRSIDIGSFVLIRRNTGLFEYMVIEKETSKLLGLRVIDETCVKKGQFVQRAYREKVVVITEATSISYAKINSVKGKLPIQYTDRIVKKYTEYINNQKRIAERRILNSARRQGDRGDSGNAWDGLSMSKNYIKMYRG